MKTFRTMKDRLFSQSRTRLVLGSTLFLILAYLLTYPFTSTPYPSFRPYRPIQEETYTYPPHPTAGNQTTSKRVAIIGAGASGSSAAFFLRRAARVAEARLGVEEGSLLGDIVVFEKEGYVGGRSTTVFPHGDQRLRSQELGASIFVDANRNLMKAVKYFNLTLASPDFGESGVGIWDGSEFLFTTSTSSSRLASWYDALAALTRYGPLSPYRTKKAVANLLQKFANLYDPTWLSQQKAARSVEDFAEKVGLGNEFTTRWGDDWALNVVGVGQRWMSEIMEGSTRVNYASDMNKIHALGAGVSMATGGASAVAGGNWQIFRAMLDDSKAQIHLGTEVTDIIPLEVEEGTSPQFRVTTNISSIDDSEPFDQVFFAAPWHSSPISKNLQKHFNEKIPEQAYVRLHVTYLTTTSPTPNPLFFNLPENSKIPTTILTSGITSRTTLSHPPPRFQSITYHGETIPGSGEFVVKIFSLTMLSDRLIRELFGGDPTWLLRKEWDSYPRLGVVSGYPPVEPVDGVQYLASLEPWVSTMETQTLSAREGVARVAEDWWGLGMGECRGEAEAWDWTC